MLHAFEISGFRRFLRYPSIARIEPPTPTRAEDNRQHSTAWPVAGSLHEYPRLLRHLPEIRG